MEITDATTITMSLAMLGTVAGGVSAWAVALYRLRQVERAIEELEEAQARGRERQERDHVRIVLLESRAAVPVLSSLDPTPVIGMPVASPPSARSGQQD